jgi:L-lactate dehydrogenase (cytochrome)
MDIERACELTEGQAWYQLYNPTEAHIRKDLLNRAASAGCPVLVVLCDVPTFGYRPRDYRNGLAMPPKMSAGNIMQILGKPRWAYSTLKYGQPTFETMKPYTPEGLNLKQLGLFMDKTFSGKLDEERVKPIRDQWKGKLVLRGLLRNGIPGKQSALDSMESSFPITGGGSWMRVNLPLSP